MEIPDVGSMLLDEETCLLEFQQRREQLTALWESWQEFQTNGCLTRPGAVRPEVLASWERSRASGLDPYAPLESTYLSEKELRFRLEETRLLVEVAEPVVRTLAQNVEGSAFRVDLVDPDLYILAQYGDETVREEAGKRGSAPGADRSEERCGTNAINLAIKLRRPIQIVGPEHYNANLHYWTCSAVPILSPQGELLGGINIAGHFSLLHKHTLGMAIAVGRAIEQSVEQRRLLAALELSYEYLDNVFHSVSDGIIATDAKGMITTLNQAAREFLAAQPERVIGRPVAEVFPSSSLFAEVLETEEPIANREISLRVAGRTRSFVATLETLNSRQGLEGAVCVLKPLASAKGFVNRLAGLRAHFTFGDIVGDSLEFRRAVQLSRQAAELPTTILLQGESGTGKELFAQGIHNASQVADGPFVAVNCAGIPGELVESELFGYEGGAFTGAKKDGQPGKFELAEGGTIFLDEIGSMPLSMQAKLLRVLQNKAIMRVGGVTETPVNARLICATNCDLWQQVREGSFREDLFYRINVLTIVIPPLRERFDDIPRLVEHFRNRLSQKLGVEFTISGEVFPLLSSYHWPGNIRELENLIERSAVVALSRGSHQVTPHDMLSYPGLREVAGRSAPGKRVEAGGYDLEEAQLAAIKGALATSGGNMSKAAQLLGIHRSTLYRKLQAYGGNVAWRDTCRNLARYSDRQQT